MKKGLILSAVFGGFLLASGSLLAGKGNTTVIVEHIPPTIKGIGKKPVEVSSTVTEDSEAVILEISAAAVPAHLGHGDCIAEPVSGELEDVLDENFDNYYCEDAPLPF